MALSTIQFDTTVYWAEGDGIAGVSFSKTDEFLGSPEDATVLSVLEGTGETDILTFVLLWPNDPVAGDIVTFEYEAASGFYQDSGAVLMADKTLNVRNCGAPLPPLVLISLGNMSNYVGDVISIDISAGFDEGTGVLTGYGVTGLPSGLVFDGVHTITGTLDTIAPYSVEVTCTTDVAPPAVDSFTWDVLVVPVAPTVVTPMANQSDPWGTVIHLNVISGFDVGTGTPVFTVDNAPAGLLFDGTYLDGTLNTADTYLAVTVTCATGVLPDAEDIFEWEVTAVAPTVVTPIVDQSDIVGTVINMDMTTGFDTGSGTPVVFTMGDIPAGLSFDGQFLTGTLTTVATYNPTVTCSTGVAPDAVDTIVWDVATGVPVTARWWLTDRRLLDPALAARGRKTAGATVVNKLHPIANSLKAYFLFPLFKNLVGEGSGNNKDALIEGNHLHLDTDTDRVLLLPGAEVADITTQVTVFIDGGSKGTGGANQVSLFGCVASDLGSRFGAHVPYNNGTVYWDFGGATENVTRESISGLSFSYDDKWCFTVGPRGMEIWQNGVKVSSNTATPTRVNTSVTEWALGRHNTTALAAHANDAKVKSVALFTKQLSIAEIKSLFADPYQILKPVVDSLSFEVLPPAPAARWWLNARKLIEPYLSMPGKKPIGAVEIDRSNPIARGLTLVNVTKNGYKDVLGNSPQSIGTSNSIERDVNGAYFPSLGTAYQVTYAKQDKWDGGELTFMVGVMPASVTATRTYLSRFGDGAGIDSWVLRTSSGVAQFGVNTGSWGIATGPAPTINKFHIFAGTYDGNKVIAYLDGVAGTPLAKTGVTNSAARLVIGNAGPSVTGEHGIARQFFAFGWDRALSAKEIESLSRDPYQILRPVVDSLSFEVLPPAPTAGSLNFDSYSVGAISLPNADLSSFYPSGSAAASLSIVDELVSVMPYTGSPTLKSTNTVTGNGVWKLLGTPNTGGDFTYRARVIGGTGHTNTQFGLAFRVTDYNNCVFAFFRNGSNGFMIYENIAGSLTQGTSQPGFAVSIGVSYWLEAVMVGADLTVTVYSDSGYTTQIGQASITLAGNTTGSLGLSHFAQTPGTCYWDDISWA